VTLPNVIMTDSGIDRTIDPLNHSRSHQCEKTSRDLIKTLYDTNPSVQMTLDRNYKEWNSLTEPQWKSRFIEHPTTCIVIRSHPIVPTEEQIEKRKKVEIDPDVLGEQSDEFEEYKYQTFLDEIKDAIEANKMTSEERIKFILNDIDKDRERILKDAIARLQVKNKSNKSLL
jgi:arylamine N-acetyltransferase